MATSERRICINHLVLVAPPILNTHAINLKKDNPYVKNHLRKSHFYMICGREKAIFSGCSKSRDGSMINIRITLSSGISSHGIIHVKNIKYMREKQFGDKVVIQLKQDQNFLMLYSEGEKIFGVTPDQLLMFRGRKELLVSGFDNFIEMMTFDLLYVGIAKENQDSYSRLISKGHTARMNILANEKQRTPGARVSDETYLLLFRVEPHTLDVFGDDSSFDDEDLNQSIDYHRIVADVEKAIISTLRPKYNIQRYANYPKGKDGLYNWVYDAYSYTIAEGFAFNTDYGTIKGGRDSDDFLMSNDADFILVEEGKSTFSRSGVDFNIPIDEQTK